MQRRHTIALAAAILIGSVQAGAEPLGGDIHYSGTLDIAIPETSSTYVNWQTGDVCQGLQGDCDINAYHVAVQAWYHWNGEAFVTNPVFTFIYPDQGGVFADPYLGVLQPGDAVHSGLRFDDGLGDVGGGVWDGTPSTSWWAGSDAYLGFSFRNRETHQINFGYAHFVTTGPSGYPMTLVDYAYDRTGAGITIPTSPISPTVRLNFEPALVETGSKSALTITLRNGAEEDAYFWADFIDPLPAGLVATDATSDCGNVSVADGGASIVLAQADALIPAMGTCAITATVQAVSAGTWTDRIPGPSLVTNQGAEMSDAVGTLRIIDAGGPFPPDEDFDAVAAPSLPTTGWFSVDWLGNFIGLPDLPPSAWVTTDQKADSGSQSAYVTDATILGGGGYPTDISLESPVFTAGRDARITFRQSYDFFETDSRWYDDGGVLEISINGGPFEDILEAGGYFAEGGYLDRIHDISDNALHGRLAWGSWTGDDVWVTDTAGLPPQAEGQAVQLRWRFGTDHTNKSQWWIDSVHADTGSTATTHPPRVEVAFSPPLVVAGTPSVLTVSLYNDQDIPGVLTQDFVDRLPEGLEAGDATTACQCLTSTCEVGVNADNELRLTLSDDSAYMIPPGGSCSITVDVSATSAGEFDNVVAPDALVVNWEFGNRAPATARMVALEPVDCLFADGFDGVEACGSVGGGGQPGTYTSAVSFFANVAPGYHEEFFDTVLAGQRLSWTSADDDGLGFVLASAGNRDIGIYAWPNQVTTDLSTSALTVTFAGEDVTAVGGHFWATDVDGNPTGTDISIALSDGTSYRFASAGPDDFRGFVTDSPITSMTIDAPSEDPNGDVLFGRMSDLVVGRRGGSTIEQP